MRLLNASLSALCGLAITCSCWGQEAVDVDLSRSLQEAWQLRVQGGVVKRLPEPSELEKAFEAYHFEAILETMETVMGAVRSYATETYPQRPPVILSGNPAGAKHIKRWPQLARYFDYLNSECNVASLGNEQVLEQLLWINAQMEAQGATLAVMPDAASNLAWSKREDPLAYARATGLVYAMGAHMHVPWCLYDGTMRNRFYGSLQGHQPIYRMIDAHRDYLDGYVPALWHVLEVPVSAAGEALVNPEGQLNLLRKAGVPTVVRYVTVEGELYGDENFNGQPMTRLVAGDTQDAALGAGPIALAGEFATQFEAPVIRVSAEPSVYPAVVHLVRRLDGSGAQQQGNGTFCIQENLLNGAQVKDVQIASVQWQDGDKATVDWEALPSGQIEVRVQNVPAWAMLRIETQQPTQLAGVGRSAFRDSMPESEILLMRMIRFSDTWMRPQWVDEALASATDPLDGYHVDRISWSYDRSGQTMDYAQKRGIAFHGSDSFLHTHMLSAARQWTLDTGIASAPADSDLWIRDFSGWPMTIRPDWNPPRYGASFANEDYIQMMIERAKRWIDEGVNGIQFDDLSGMVNRTWKYGGDFSKASLSGFRDYLLRHSYPDVTAQTPLEVIRKQLLDAMKLERATHLVDANFPSKEQRGWLSVPYRATSTGYPGLVWIGTPALPVGKGAMLAQFDIRLHDAQSPPLEFLLLDGNYTEYLSRLDFPATWLKDPRVRSGDWVSVRLRYDPASQSLQYALGEGGDWSEAVQLLTPIDARTTTLAVALNVNPLLGGVDVRRIQFGFEPVR